MKYFPTLCVDNFFSDPDQVREFALKQKFMKMSDTYAGTRTDEIFNIDKQFFEVMCHRVLSLFNDVKEVHSLRMTMRFQKIPRISDTHPELNQGWVHDDGENIFAGVVYLDPTPNPDSGTSLYRLKEGESPTDIAHSETKRALYGDRLEDAQVAVDAITDHNGKFIETARFSNVYNRLVCYDASVFHKANSYNNDEERLTLVFFLQEYHADSVPLLRMKEFII
jgi:hypothetical protein